MFALATPFTCPGCTPDHPFRLALGSPERAGLQLDGLIRPLAGDVVVAERVPDSVCLRARAAGLLLGREHGPARPSWVVGFGSAAWVHTGGLFRDDDPPGRLEVIVPPGGRRPGGRSGLHGRQVMLAPGEVLEIHGVPVTTPVRTAADLARDLPAEQAIEVLRRLGRHSGVRPPQVLRQLSRMRYARGSQQARPVVRAWADVPDPW